MCDIVRTDALERQDTHIAVEIVMRMFTLNIYKLSLQLNLLEDELGKDHHPPLKLVKRNMKPEL